MTATIAIAALVVVAGALGLAAYMARNATAATKTALDDRARTADALFDLATANGEIERAEFETAALKQALASATQRAEALEQELGHALERTALGAGLASDDVAGRVLRLSQAWGASREVPAVAVGAVPETPAAVAPDADGK